MSTDAAQDALGDAITKTLATISDAVAAIAEFVPDPSLTAEPATLDNLHLLGDAADALVNEPGEIGDAASALVGAINIATRAGDAADDMTEGRAALTPAGVGLVLGDLENARSCARDAIGVIGVLRYVRQVTKAKDLHEQLARAEDEVKRIRGDRDNLIREAITRGASMYWIAKTLDISEHSVSRIRDRSTKD